MIDYMLYKILPDDDQIYNVFGEFKYYIYDLIKKQNFRKLQEKQINKKDRYKMKSLTEFIKDSDIYTFQLLGLYDTDDEDILTFNIDEKYGAFEGQLELCKYIYNEIENSRNIIHSKDFKIDNFKVFFKELQVELSYKNSAFKPEKSIFNEKDKIFDIIYIRLNKYSKKSSQIRQLFHELTHAWTDYGYYTKKYPYTLKEIVSTRKYKSSTEDLPEQYKKLKQHNEDFANIIINVAKSGYILNRIERNAFVSEIQGELLNHEGQFFTFPEFRNIIWKLHEIDNFLRLYSYLENLKNSDDKNYQTKFLILYNSLLKDKQYNTFNQLYKSLSKELIKAFDKISSTISKVYCDWVLSQRELMEENVTDKNFDLLINI